MKIQNDLAKSNQRSATSNQQPSFAEASEVKASNQMKLAVGSRQLAGFGALSPEP